MRFEKDGLVTIQISGLPFAQREPDADVVHLASDYHDAERDPKMVQALSVARYAYETVTRALNHPTLPGRLPSSEAVLTAILYRFGAWCVGQERPFIAKECRAERDAEVRRLRAQLLKTVEELDRILAVSAGDSGG